MTNAALQLYQEPLQAAAALSRVETKLDGIEGRGEQPTLPGTL